MSDAAGGLEVILRFEQEGEIFDVPVTVTLNYRSGASEDIIVPVTDENHGATRAARRPAPRGGRQPGSRRARPDR